MTDIDDYDDDPQADYEPDPTDYLERRAMDEWWALPGWRRLAHRALRSWRDPWRQRMGVLGWRVLYRAWRRARAGPEPFAAEPPF